MGKVTAVITLNMDSQKVYKYLKDRYDSERYKQACIDTKGYVPPIKLVENEVNSKLKFTVMGYDALLKMHMGSWTWTYRLKEIDAHKAELTLSYQWSFLMTLLAMGTIKSQATNELVETVLALDALEQAVVLV